MPADDKIDGLLSVAFPLEGFDIGVIWKNCGGENNTFFYSIPSNNFSFIAAGSIFEINESGSDRLNKTALIFRNFIKNAVNNYSDFEIRSVPMFVGGMKFAPEENPDKIWDNYSDSHWFIPRYIFLRNNEKHFLIINFFNESVSLEIYNFVLGRGLSLLDYSDNGTHNTNQAKILSSNINDSREKEKWVEQVKHALAQINKGEFQKIVLSRQVKLELDGSPNFAEIFNQLSKDYPRCYIFAFKKNDSVFFGASPETLAKVSEGWVEADALAGSIQRGSTDEEDAAYENELLMSKKNLNEQKAVVEFIKNSFKDFSDEIFYDEHPVIRKLPNIQHLWTPIKAKLNKDKDIFFILKDIHPTPAICGVPWSNALVSIKKMENHNRGLFAGMIGWFNIDNEGEFAVAIRSALYKKNIVYAFAGCGIVEGSDPELEYVESELKLKPILSLFGNE